MWVLHLTSWPTWTLHLKAWPNSAICTHHLICWGGISESVHFIWKYELISDVCGHFIWHRGVYLNLNTSSENINSYLMFIWTSSRSLHLILGWYIWIWTFTWKYQFISYVHLNFILFASSDTGGIYLISAFTSSEKLTVTTHIMNSWTLNNLCRLLYVVVIVVTISYSCCYFWSFLSVIVHV